MSETIFFRVDANNQIGIGHAMRCITIANKLQEKGFQTLFLVSDRESAQIIENCGMQFLCLDTDYQNMTVEEAVDILKRMKERECRRLIVDSYYVRPEYLVCLKKQPEILVTCFWCFEQEINVDVLINYNINYNSKFYEKTYLNKNVKLLLGSDYIPLREEFRTTDYATKPQVETVLLMTGGTDTFNFMGQFLKYVREENLYDGVHFICVSGKYNPHLEQLKEIQDTWDNIEVIERTGKMADLMKQSDLVLSAGGTTMYELCAIGVPTILFSFADNQISEATYMGEQGIVPYVGDIREADFWEKMLEQFQKCFSNVEGRKHISEKMHNLIDGNGIERIVDAVSEV